MEALTAPLFLKSELRSESTLPLLNFLLHTLPESSTEQVTANLHYYSVTIGKERRPIPDESKQLEPVLLELIEKGAGPVKGKPTASLRVFTSQ